MPTLPQTQTAWFETASTFTVRSLGLCEPIETPTSEQSQPAEMMRLAREVVASCSNLDHPERSRRWIDHLLRAVRRSFHDLDARRACAYDARPATGDHESNADDRAGESATHNDFDPGVHGDGR
jgi:hypothetical protein